MHVVDHDESEHVGPGRPAKYPWTDWFINEKEVWIARGEDYDIAPESLRPQIHIQARRRGGRVSTKIKREHTDGKEYIIILYRNEDLPRGGTHHAAAAPVQDEDFEFVKDA